MKQKTAFTKLRDAVAVDAAKAVAAGSRLAGNQGTSISGKAAMAISPAVLGDLAGQVKKTVYAVCGTNGKTTTNNLLCAMLEAGGNRVVCNRLGANMLPGIAGAFVRAAGPSGHLDADYACLEIDEASAHLVFQHVRPQYLILTNLFRDQLDRYGEIDITSGLLEQAVRMVPDMKLIVNADDPFSVSLAVKSGHPYICYGIPEPAVSMKDGADLSGGTVPGSREIRESGFCRICGAPLAYDFYHFSQMGMYHCTACSFRRPAARYEAKDIQLGGGVSFSVENSRIESSLAGEYSVYNLLAVWSVLREDGKEPVSAERFNGVLRNYHTQFGRNEHFRIYGREVILNLAKNPAGFNQNIEAMLEDPRKKSLVIVINDNDQDGTDVSWLWDVDFERIRDESVLSVTVSGIRALDMALRLKYDGISADIAETAEQVVEAQLAGGGRNHADNAETSERAAQAKPAAGDEVLYVLVNYTALFSIHQYLLKKERDGKALRKTKMWGRLRKRPETGKKTGDRKGAGHETS